MKNTISYIIAAAAALSVFACCTKNEPKLQFAVSTDSIAAPSAGGSFELKLTSSEAWSATTDLPWVTVSPANGPASAVCSVSVDSSLVNTPRSGIIRFRNRETGETRDLSIEQSGFNYVIKLADAQKKLKSFDYSEKREFNVTVSTNVPFEVVIPSSAKNWLSCEEPKFNFDRGARPRDIKLTFRWGINSVPMERDAMVSFVPKNGWSVDSSDELKVVQEAAMVIEPGHRGDSLAVLALARNMNLWSSIVAAEPMADWDFVTLWEETDKGYTPEKKGRVRALSLFLFQTSECIPYEVQYLTECEDLSFFSNVNSFIHSIDLGEYVCKLEKLKRLRVSAYGLTTLPEDLKNLKNLESLDISSNNFSTIPSVLTPENFPKLKSLFLNTCQRYYILDLSNTVSRDLGGFKGKFPRRLLEWENLDTLRLSVNFLEGEIPDMKDYARVYTEEDCAKMNLPTTLAGTPKVLPNARFFAFNLNRLYGTLPDWILYHPHLVDWQPYALCYPQEGRASNGKVAVFNNVPVNMDYYWKFYEGYKEHVDIYIGD